MIRKIIRLSKGTQGMLNDIIKGVGVKTTRSGVLQAAVHHAIGKTAKLDFLPGLVDDAAGNRPGDSICVSLTYGNMVEVDELSKRWNCSDNKVFLTAIILMFYEDYSVIQQAIVDYANAGVKEKNIGGRPKQLEGDVERLSFNMIKAEAAQLREAAKEAGLSVGLFIRMIVKDYLKGEANNDKEV